MKHFAVVGDPVSHSLSPLIHNTLISRRGLSARYSAIRIEKGGLAALAGMNLSGGNITMPHKEDALSFMDAVDPEAAALGSVNTFVCRNGVTRGFSTDADGFSEALKRSGTGFYGRRVLILGAGGACRALAFRAVRDGVERVTIACRTPDKASPIADSVRSVYGKALGMAGFSGEALRSECAGADILINATPLGMDGCRSDFDDLGFLAGLPAGARVFDLICSPRKTRFLEAAEALGLPAQNGVIMLIWQAFHAFNHFFGVMPGKDDEDAILEKIDESAK